MDGSHKSKKSITQKTDSVKSNTTNKNMQKKENNTQDDGIRYMKKSNNIAKTSKPVYNANERERDTNGKKQRVEQSRGNISKQFTKKTDSKSETRINEKREYEKKFEEAMKNVATNQSDNENTKRNKIILRNIYGINMNTIKNDSEFGGGIYNNEINISEDILNSNDANIAVGHELFEFIRETRKDIRNEYIEPLIDEILKDNNFKEVFKEYVDNSSIEDKQLLLNNPRYIAKEILFDEAGFMFNNDDFNLGIKKQKTDLMNYGNKLKMSNSILQMGLLKIEKLARKKENSNKSSFSMEKDNQGRILTKEQQEFFKNSKVRDEKGNLLVVYHGSESKFDEFTLDVNWFTDSKEYSEYYGRKQNKLQKTFNVEPKKSKYTYEVYINIKNPKILSNIDGYLQEYNMSKEQFGTYVKTFLEESNIPYNDFKNIVDDYNSKKNESEQATRIYTIVNSKEFRDYLISKGYDGIITNEKGNNSFAVFSRGQIKNIDNTNPTSDSDIRYAKKTGEIEPGQTNAERTDAYIEQEIKKIEQSGKWDNSIPPTSRTDIRKAIEDYLGLGIKRGRFRQSAYALYKMDRDIIRTKELKDMDSILHETGHALDNRLNIDKEKIADELLSAANALEGYENESREVKLDEGFAEVIREYAIIPNQAKIDYPQTVSVIEKIKANDKEFNRFITRLQNQTYNYIHQNPNNRVLSNISIGEETDKRPLTKNWIKQEVMRNIYDKDYALKSAVNELAKAGGKTVNQIKASQNAYYLTRLASGVDTKVASMLSEGYIDTNGNKIIPGLKQIGEILGNDASRYNDLRTYLVAQRDLEYKAKTLKTGIRTMDSKAVIERFKKDLQIQKAAKIIYDTLDGVMQYAVDNHLISQDEVDALKKSNAFYVPMQRVIENNHNNVGKRGAVADIIKRRTGSELDVKDVLENIVANSANIIQQVENNNILKALYIEGEKSKLTGAIYDVIPAPMTKIGTAKLQTWQNELEKQGIDISKIDFDKTIDLFSPNNKIDTKNLITSFINDQGQRVYLQFNDELIFNSLMNLDGKMMSQVLDINRKLNMPLRYGATMANLGFAIPNMISDTAQAAIYSDAGFIPIVDNVIGLIDVLASTNKNARDFLNKVAPEYAKRKAKLYTLYQQSGASSATRMSQYRKSTQEIMKDIYGTSSKNLGIQGKYKPLKRLLNILTYIPELSEQSTRLRVFEKNYEMYKNKGTEETDARILAALESRDATQDFGRTGNLTREINQLIPFSAARVGSAYTFAEKVKANPKRTAMRTAILMAIGMAIKAIGYDDKEIEELNQRKKDDNFVIKVGDRVVTIKKPQGILRSILNFEEYIQDLFTGHIDDGKAGERLGEWINNTIMDNMPADSVTGLVPNMVAPLIENAINKDLYYNTDIVKSWDLDLPDSEQYYEYNSQLAIWLGKIFNYSPAKIDNLISGYFAGLGTQVTNAIDWVSGKLGLSAEKPNMGAEQNAVGKRFIVNVNNNSASLDEVYNLKTELTKKKNGGTITNTEEEKLEKVTDATSNIAKINKQIKEIKKDLTMNANEKADKIRELQEQRTDIARQALGKELINSSNKSKIESTQFYITSNTLSKSGYKLDMTSEMKKEYEKLASEYYNKYKSQGLYSKEKLESLKSKAKDYAKNQMFSRYKSKAYKSK